jgi:hypothetical protein
MPIELMKTSRFEAGRVHGVDDGLGLLRHRPAQVRVDHVLPLHRGYQGLTVHHVAFDDRHPGRVGIVQPAGVSQEQRQLHIGAFNEERSCVAGKPAIGAEDEYAGLCCRRCFS